MTKLGVLPDGAIFGPAPIFTECRCTLRRVKAVNKEWVEVSIEYACQSCCAGYGRNGGWSNEWSAAAVVVFDPLAHALRNFEAR